MSISSRSIKSVRSAGFSLIQIMVATAMLSGITVGVVKMQDIQLRGQKKIAQNFTVIQFIENIETILSNPINCTGNLAGKRVGEDISKLSVFEKSFSAGRISVESVSDIVDLNNKKLIGEMEGMLNISNMVLEEEIDSTGKRHFLKVVFSLTEKNQKMFGGAVDFAHRIPLYIQFDKTKTTEVAQCAYTQEALMAQMCEMGFGGQYSSSDQTCRSISIADSTDSITGIQTPAVNIKGDMIVKGKFAVNGSSPTPSGTSGDVIEFDGSQGMLHLTGGLTVGDIEMKKRAGGEAWDITGINTLYAETLNISNSIQTAALLYTSDERMKDNISPLEESVLNDAYNLNGVEFKWKENKDDRKHFGFIAQEVEKIFPNLVYTDSKTGLKSVSYNEFIPILIELVKKQRQEIDDLEKTLSQSNISKR